jgi:hypothetical protein
MSEPLNFLSMQMKYIGVVWYIENLILFVGRGKISHYGFNESLPAMYGQETYPQFNVHRSVISLFESCCVKLHDPKVVLLYTNCQSHHVIVRELQTRRCVFYGLAITSLLEKMADSLFAPLL